MSLGFFWRRYFSGPTATLRLSLAGITTATFRHRERRGLFEIVCLYVLYLTWDDLHQSSACTVTVSFTPCILIDFVVFCSNYRESLKKRKEFAEKMTGVLVKWIVPEVEMELWTLLTTGNHSNINELDISVRHQTYTSTEKSCPRFRVYKLQNTLSLRTPTMDSFLHG